MRIEVRNTGIVRGSAGIVSHLHFTLLVAVLGVTSVCARTAFADSIPDGESATLGIPAARGFKLSLDVPRPTGTIECRLVDESGSTQLVTQIIFDPSGNGRYEVDLAYQGSEGLVDVESLLPGLNLVGELEGESNQHFWFECTKLNSCKKIYSWEDGTVITIPSPSSAEGGDDILKVTTPTGTFMDRAPFALSAEPATSALVRNDTNGPIDAAAMVPQKVPVVGNWGLVVLLSLVLVLARALLARRSRGEGQTGLSGSV